MHIRTFVRGSQSQPFLFFHRLTLVDQQPLVTRFRPTAICPRTFVREKITWASTAKKKNFTPELSTLPPPAPQKALGEVNLHRRAVLVTGVRCTLWNVTEILQKVRGGALEYARFQPGWGGLTLSFLLSHSADDFVRKILSDPQNLRRFANNKTATWEWLPPAPLPKSVTGVSHRTSPRRALFVSHHPDWSYPGNFSQFGELELNWKLHGRKLFVQYFEIADAIRVCLLQSFSTLCIDRSSAGA